MVTTVMREEKGLTLRLPALAEDTPTAPVAAQNLFSIRLNAYDQLLVEGNRRPALTGLRNDLKVFILNHGQKADLSDSPAKAIVSLKADRGTSHRAYIATLDEIQAAYYEIYAQRAGITPTAFRKLEVTNPEQRALYEKARKGIPMNISIAEPSQVPQ